MTGSTVSALIRCDDPALRPRRRRDVTTTVSTIDGGVPVGATLGVTFTEAAVWDVARIASPLRLRQLAPPRRSFFEVLTR